MQTAKQFGEAELPPSLATDCPAKDFPTPSVTAPSSQSRHRFTMVQMDHACRLYHPPTKTLAGGSTDDHPSEIEGLCAWSRFQSLA
jgi:hypothetical protein